jgi:hypothetical protein
MKSMTRETIEKLGSLFLAVFSIGLALVMASQMDLSQRIGALVAVSGSLALAALVRKWPHPVKVESDHRRGE